MSIVSTRFRDFSDAIADMCERMVSASVVGEAERRFHRRLAGVALFAPFLAMGAALPSMAVHMGAGAMIAALFGTFSASWLVALAAACNDRARLAAVTALAVAGVGLAGLLPLSGGLASPLAIFALAIVAEAAWVAGRPGARWAAAASAIAIAVQPALPLSLSIEPAASAWQWLAPLAWLGTVLWRADIGGRRDKMDAGLEASVRLEKMIDGVVFSLSRSGDVMHVSSKARSILNLQPDLLAGSGLFERVHLSDRVAYLSAIADLREGAAARSLDVLVRMPGAEPGVVDNYRPFRLEFMRAGPDEAITLILRDNADVAGLRGALEAARETADKAEVTKGRFLAAVSHELRTPLNAIIGFSDMLLAEMVGEFKDPRQKEYVALVRDSGQHLLDVVTAILDVSKIEAGTYAAQPEPFRFAETVDRVRAMMRMQAEAREIDLSLRVPSECGEINADRRAVQQVLINLVSNAIKFTPEGGTVEIGAQRLGSHLHFWVSDTGIGIAEHDLARLGKPFTQIQNDYTRRFEGTGLGLSLVKGLVELHQGTMSIESAPGLGTKVAVSLPVHGPVAGQARAVVLPLASAKSVREDGNAPLRKTA